MKMPVIIRRLCCCQETLICVLSSMVVQYLVETVMSGLFLMNGTTVGIGMSQYPIQRLILSIQQQC